MALAHLGVTVEISDLDTEDSVEAKVMRRFYTQARQQTLRDFDWHFARKKAALGLIDTDTTREFLYAYTYPADCLHFRRVLSDYRNDAPDTRVPFELKHGTSATEIWTDRSSAYGEYTVDVTPNSGRMTADCIMALSYRLAAFAAPALTRGDPFQLQNRVMTFYQFELAKAEANSNNEAAPDPQPDAEMHRGRG